MISTDQIQRARILIVDDNKTNVLLLEKMLTMGGYSNIRTLTDSRQVKAVYQEYRPDLILLDLKMPYLDGFEVMEQLREITDDSYIPVMAITALQDSETRLRALTSGAKDFINKPIDHTEVLPRIHNMLEIRLLHNKVKTQITTLEHKLEEHTVELKETRLEIIRRLCRAAEYRDNETGLHIIRMSKITHLLASKIGLSKEHCELILNASPMHDIGKIGIPDRILQKPGKLDANEFAIMKTHTIIGANMLSDHTSKLMNKAHDIALTHHEKWNGTGYPVGLKGEEIPVEGRICALSDVFDALTSFRLYKKAWTYQEALDEINREKGKHFDPTIVDLFNEIFDQILDIQEEYKDPDPLSDV
ncbi:MAG: HD domain-containing phosphohydrolase [bacterium]